LLFNNNTQRQRFIQQKGFDSSCQRINITRMWIDNGLERVNKLSAIGVLFPLYPRAAVISQARTIDPSKNCSRPQWCNIWPRQRPR
jgi:hypothetical protein